MKIGILSKNYAAKRLFLNKIQDAEYKDIRFYNYYLWKNAHLLFLRMIGKLKLSPEEAASKLFYDYKALFPTKCNIFHFFNTINYSKRTPWVISVESAVPWPLEVIKCVESPSGNFEMIKGNKYVERALHYLSLPNCKGLLALSECSLNIQKELLRQFPKYEASICNKLILLSPPQCPIINSIADKNLSYLSTTPLTFIFVGMDYFRKGGREMLDVLMNLHQSYDFRLILISNLRIDEQRYLQSEDERERTAKIIKENADWIEWHKYLPNEQVMEKLKKAHVALLPTWMDTYGYSVLECQACGTPVISTSLRALTEENGEDVGWLVEVPVNRLNNPIHVTHEQQQLFKEKLLLGLKEKIEYLLNHHEEIEHKANNCLVKIKCKHDPATYSEKLSLIYQSKISML